RTDGGDGRGGPAHVLAGDAALRRRRQDGAVRDPLSRGGRRERRPRRADGPRPRGRGRDDHRDQGPRRHADDSGNAPRGAPRRARTAPRGQLRRPTRRRGEPRVPRLRSGDPGVAAPVSGGQGHRDHRRRSRGCVPAADRRPRLRGAVAGRDRGVGAVSAVAYTRYELLRTVRERRLLLFGFGFPLILYFVIAIPNRHIKDFSGTGVSAALYYMVSLASFGTMMSMVSTGGRIAGERQVGWTRQLRITPLNPRSYLRAKVL